MRKAVIDVGSNSVLLLVAEWGPRGWEPLYESSEVTALGEGTKQSGLLKEPNLSHTLAAIARATAKAKAEGAEEVKIAATMAARIASNQAELVERAAAQETPLVVLSGDREAELGFRAVADDPAFADHPTLSIIDVGGHSTELVTASGSETHFRKSFAIGTLALEAPEVVTGPDLLRLATQIDDQIAMAYRPHEAGLAIALGATGTNLVTIREKMTTWQPQKVHGAWLDYEEVSKAAAWLGAMAPAERAAVPGLEKGRERSIHLGALILERFLFSIRTYGCRVSVRGWRHAYL